MKGSTQQCSGVRKSENHGSRPVAHLATIGGVNDLTQNLKLADGMGALLYAVGGAMLGCAVHCTVYLGELFLAGKLGA